MKIMSLLFLFFGTCYAAQNSSLSHRETIKPFMNYVFDMVKSNEFIDHINTLMDEGNNAKARDMVASMYAATKDLDATIFKILYFHAARRKSAACLKLFIDLHGDRTVFQDMVDDSGNTLLHYAAWNESIDVISYLLEEVFNGKSLLIQDNNGNNPLHAASYKGSADIAKRLIEYSMMRSEGWELITQKNKYGDTSLHLASTISHTSVTILKAAKQLQKLDEIVLIKDNCSRTPIFLSPILLAQYTYLKYY